MKSDFDILIVGGGMVGACAAALLSAEPTLADARIALLESRPPEPPRAELDLRVSAISRASERILAHAHAWDLIGEEHRSPYERMCVWDAGTPPDSANALHFSADETTEPNLGYIVENSRVQWALWQCAPLKRVVVLNSALAQLEFTTDAARVTLADGRAVRVRLVLAADGAASPSREMAGIATRGWAYEQSAVVTHVRTSRPHARTAWQRFIATGPVAFLPLRDGRSSIVWSTSHAHAEELAALDDQAFATALQTASDNVLGAINVTAPRARFPLQLKHAREYTKPGFALLGDAAHAIHPLAGQGVNLGFMDAAALVETLVDARRAGASLAELGDPRVLRRYERWRKSENALALGLVDGINRLFSNENPLLGALRRAGFAFVERTPLAKQFFVMRALGLAGERPKMVAAYGKA